MDFLLIDEFEKIPAEIFEDLYAAVALEKARLVMISTLNENAEKTR
jgi:hypothetical protein